MEQTKKCPLDYIPERLHWNDKPIIKEFFENEKLYYRVDPNKVSGLPYEFLNVTLSNISTNRSGIAPNLLSEKEDVLFNIDETDNLEKHKDKEVVHFNIIDPKLFPLNHQSNDGKINVLVELLHDPLPCNYSHSIFRFKYNGEIVTFNNFSQSLGKGNKLHSRLRKGIRLDFHQLIVADTN